MSAVVTLLAVVHLTGLASGQLAAPAITDAPAAGPTVPAPPPLPQGVPDRIRITDGREYVGRIVGEAGNAIDIEDLEGTRHAVPFTVIVDVERGGRKVLPAAPPGPDLGPVPALQERLTLSFDIASIERERARLTYGDKAFLLALGTVTAVVGYAGFRGETGRVVGLVGVLEAAVGGIGLGVTFVRDWNLERRSLRARERYGALEPQALVPVPGQVVVSMRF